MLDTIEVDLGPVVATVASRAGPRVLAYTRAGRAALFADLPDATIAGGAYRLLGGHRLWRAPEDPAVTHQPDDEGVTATVLEGGVELVGAPDRDGVVKRVTVRQRGEATVVDHELTNHGPTPVRTAAWAITQLTPGGTAVLPQPVGDPAAWLPDRRLVLWPYADPGDPEVRLGLHEIRVEGSRRPGRFKLGFANRRGWVAYHLGDQVFVKWAPLHDDAAEHADLGSSVECYRDERFLELETLGPLVTLEPGEAVTHREVWLLADADDASLPDLLAALPAVAPEPAA